MRCFARQGGYSHRRDEDAGVRYHGGAAIEQLCLLVPLEGFRSRAETRRVEAKVTS